MNSTRPPWAVPDPLTTQAQEIRTQIFVRLNSLYVDGVPIADTEEQREGLRYSLGILRRLIIRRIARRWLEWHGRL